VAVAGGGDFLRWKAPNNHRVLYVDGELPCVTLRDWAASTIAGSEAEVLPGNLKFITPDLQERCIPDLATRAGQEQIEDHLEGVTLLVLDNLSALVRAANENEGEGWLPVQEWALALRRRGISLLFVHHAGKSGAQRGTSRREDLLDTVITLKHPADYSPSEGLRCEVHFEKTRAMLADAAKPFEVQMKNGPDGQAIWTCRDLEDVKMQQAAALFSSGASVRDVAEQLGVSKSTAHRFRKWWTGDGFGEVSHRPTA
jgi:putative DNA primase/helicase